ncbi:hypothetical protein LOZ52_002614 [Ophidiomyces ophidiicola]|nr:hypothetical protein LOZ64_000748 [Ophidiomyces ophidiicola]KAI2004954.1 hypothetical protein LOZ50_003993 [Ophidiomyces ophidiicola]KAI2013107.1 hypothetical protein LOZ49_002369 [Ophidiomyces ophidiicola]KAI2018492.1 hypothetical protein LOZ46_003840 [Ophidiomyces ophidiicola]KAI2054389.1 hypothetical protein LOZ44_002417 [Ophidiomyces ophidiicola]
MVQVLCHVLKVRNHLRYQVAFLTSELREIFANAPIMELGTTATKRKRQPIEGDCPICFSELTSDTSAIVWCEASCGNNVHKTCFEKWASNNRGKTLCCIFCRSPWKTSTSELTSIVRNASVGEEGYLNVGEAMGLPHQRGRLRSLYSAL